MVLVLDLLRQKPLALQLRLQQHREKLDLVVGQLRVPEVEDQVDSGLLAVVPGLVVEGVVEYDALVLLQVLGLVADPHAGALRPHQRQVHPELLAGGAVVGRDVGAGRDCAEEGVEVVPRDHLLQDLDCFGHFGAVFEELDVVQVQVEDVPVARVVAEGANLVLWDVLVGVGGAAVGLEASLSAQGLQLLADGGRVLFELTDPGELLPVPPRLEGQPRHQVWAPELSRMVLVGHLFAVDPHEQPRPEPADLLVVLLADFVFDELVGCEHLELREVVVFEDLVDFEPEFLLCLVDFFLLLF